MLNQNKHRAAMYRLLTGMLRDSYLAAVLGFKGGTACYFFHDLPRLSVYLDFDITAQKDDEVVRDEVYKRIKSVIDKEGFAARDASLKRNTVFFLVSYEGAAHNIKIEASRRDYPNTYEVRDFYGLPVKILVKADMFAHKLAAATDRKKTATRDFFDIWFFFKQGWPINEDIVRLRTGRDLRPYLGYVREFAKKYLSNRTILQGMRELIDEKQKVWVKTKFKDELDGIIKFYLDANRYNDKSKTSDASNP